MKTHGTGVRVRVCVRAAPHTWQAPRWRRRATAGGTAVCRRARRRTTARLRVCGWMVNACERGAAAAEPCVWYVGVFSLLSVLVCVKQRDRERKPERARAKGGRACFFLVS
jgi:hypothetical protein